MERVCSNCTHGTSTFNVILNYALKHTFQLRGMASTLCICTTVSPRQWQSWPLLGLKKDGIAVGLMSGRNGVSKTLYSRGACKANWFKRQLHCRQVVAVGWETQNNSPMACVWRWDQKKRLDYSNGPKRRKKNFRNTDIKQQGREQESTCVILGSQLKSQARLCKQL